MALIAPAGTRISGEALARPKRGGKKSRGIQEKVLFLCVYVGRPTLTVAISDMTTA